MIWAYLGHLGMDFDAENFIGHVEEQRESLGEGVSIFLIILGIDFGMGEVRR